MKRSQQQATVSGGAGEVVAMVQELAVVTSRTGLWTGSFCDRASLSGMGASQISLSVDLRGFEILRGELPGPCCI